MGAGGSVDIAQQAQEYAEASGKVELSAGLKRYCRMLKAGVPPAACLQKAELFSTQGSLSQKDVEAFQSWIGNLPDDSEHRRTDVRALLADGGITFTSGEGKDRELDRELDREVNTEGREYLDCGEESYQALYALLSGIRATMKAIKPDMDISARRIKLESELDRLVVERHRGHDGGQDTDYSGAAALLKRNLSLWEKQDRRELKYK